MSKDEFHLDAIKKLLVKQGLAGSYKDTYFARRLRIRMRKRDCENYAAYYNLLKQDSREVELFRSDLSINVTRFFRDLPSFRYFQNIAQNFLQSSFLQTRQSKFKVWSAGCAIGAEPYTLAIIFDQIRKQLSGRLTASILATDFNQVLLDIAQKGIYAQESMDEFPPSLLDEYFDPFPDDQFRLKYRVRHMVTFEHFDLTTPEYPYRDLDVIVCRNVLIYFSTEWQKKIFHQFHKCLAPNGLLFLGNTETLSPSFRSKFKNISPKHRIYQKEGGEAMDLTPTDSMRVCETCGQSFGRIIDLKIHQRTHLKEKKVPRDSQTRLKCPHCHKTFITKVRYEAHLRFFHKVENPTYDKPKLGRRKKKGTEED